MKKIFSVILGAALMATSVGTLGACNKGNGKIQIKLGMWPEAALTQDIGMYANWKKSFEEQYPEYEIVPSNYTYNTQSFMSDAESGMLPTVFQTWMTEPPDLIDNGYVRDITPQLEQLGWLDKMDDNMKAALMKDNRVYGVPRDGYALGLMINKELFAAAGIFYDADNDGSVDIIDEEGNPLYPTTFDEIYEASQIICESTEAKGLAILSSNQNGGWQFSNLAWNFGATLETQDANGKWSSHLDSTGSVNALEWIRMMKQEDLLAPGTTLPYTDWYRLIGTRAVAMCFAGSDAVSMPVTNYNFNKDNLVLVPMPGDGVHDPYCLYGGTPFMFSVDATDDQVLGALRFLEYMGRSPEVSEVAREALTTGQETAKAKGMPILPTIKPWKNQDYLAMANEIESRYINVDMKYFDAFFGALDEMKRIEEPKFCQKMYKEIDTAIQKVLERPGTADPKALLTSANATFYNSYLSKLNK